MKQFIVEGMSCAACQNRVEKAVNKVQGVTNCSVSLLTNSMGVEGNVKDIDIINAVKKAGYNAKLKTQNSSSDDISLEEESLKDTETPKLIKRLILSMFFLFLLMYITMGYNMLNWPIPKFLEHNHIGLAITQMLLAIIVMIINNKFFINGFKSLFALSPNMDSLVALGSSVSFVWSLFVLYKMCYYFTIGILNIDLMEIYHNDLYFESAAMIPALITVGKMLESMSKGKTTNALKSLMKLAPKTATIIENGIEKIVSINDVQVSDVFKVLPGQNIPVDGIVIEGTSAVNESALTGESIPVDKNIGDKVSAATTNESGVLICKAERVGKDTTLNQIINMVSDAAATKAPIARIADTVSGIFVPSVISIAIIVFILWITIGKENLAFALERSISVLVISCPCALGLATPVAIMVGNGMGAKNGILFKTSEALENFGKTQIIALDKTGTITKGEPKVTDVKPLNNIDENNLINIAYALEKNSEHPLAKAIVLFGNEKYNLNNTNFDIKNFKILPGNGLMATIDGKDVSAGSIKYINTKINLSEDILNVAEEFAQNGKTPLFFEQNNKLLGIIAVADEIKNDSKKAMEELENQGIETIMLTGDNEKTAKAIANIANIKNVVANVLPDGKEEVIKKIKKIGKTSMVGDGINDAPALVRSDIGVAIGAGVDVAIDSADIVLMNNKLTDVSAAIRLSRKTVKNIYENLFWAFFYNIICIPLAAGLFGYKLNPMLAATAMSLSSFTVCMNALRLNLFNVHNDKIDKKQYKTLNKNKIKQIIEEINNKNKTKPTIKNIEVIIEGMSCEHCEKRVKNAFEKTNKVNNILVSHINKNAKIDLNEDMNEEEIKNIIENAGYKYIKIV